MIIVNIFKIIVKNVLHKIWSKKLFDFTNPTFKTHLLVYVNSSFIDNATFMYTFVMTANMHQFQVICGK